MATRTQTPPPTSPQPDAPMFTGAAEGEVFTPFEGAVHGAPVPTGQPIPPFALKVHPRRWTVMGGHVIPLAGRLRHMPGANGADAVYDRQGRVISIDLGAARQKAEQEGWKIIPYDMAPKGRRSYLYRPNGRPDIHLLFSERAYVGSDHIDGDVNAYVAWMVQLMTPGPNGEPPFIAPPADYVLRGLADKLQGLLDGATNKAVQWPTYRKVAERHQADLDVILAELERRGVRVAAEGAEVVP